MADHYLETYFTPEVLRAQANAYGRSQRRPGAGTDALGAEERAFIAQRDSFYLATVSSTGWPYVQHRGGPAGFLQVVDERTLGFADYRGNRQLLSTGHVGANGRVALFLMDYARQERLKILGQARVVDATTDPALADRLCPDPTLRSRVERLFLIEVMSFDWNCPQFITPRYTAAEVEVAIAPLRRRVADLEQALAQARAQGAAAQPALPVSGSVDPAGP